MALSDRVAATKARVLKMKKPEVIDFIQLLVQTPGAVTIAGDGSITVDGRTLSDQEMAKLGDALPNV